MYFEFEENSGGFLARTGYKKQKITSELTGNVTKDVTKDQQIKMILKFIIENPKIKTEEIAVNLGITRRTIQRKIEEMKAQNLIKRTGGRKLGYGEIINQNNELSIVTLIQLQTVLFIVALREEINSN